MTSFNFIKIFSDVPQESSLEMWDIRHLFQQNESYFFPGIFKMHIDKWSQLEFFYKLL